MLGTECRCASSLYWFSVAYDTEWRKEIWSEMHKLGPPPPKKK